MKGTIIPITFVAITKEQVRDEKKIFLYEVDNKIYLRNFEISKLSF